MYACACLVSNSFQLLPVHFALHLSSSAKHHRVQIPSLLESRVQGRDTQEDRFQCQNNVEKRASFLCTALEAICTTFPVKKICSWNIPSYKNDWLSHFLSKIHLLVIRI